MKAYTLLTLGLACCLGVESLHAQAEADVSTLKIKGLPPGFKVVGTMKEGNDLIVTVAPAEVPALAEGAAALAPAPAVAEPRDALSGSSGPAGPDASAIAGNVDLDLPISAVPAFMALDLSPETVEHPTTPREFAGALLNGVDKQGVLQNGFALEVAPFRALGLLKVNNAEYGAPDAWLTRMLYNTSLSMATAKAAEDKKEVQLAIGLSAILFESASRDAYRNESLQAAMGQLDMPPLVSGPEQVGQENEQNKKMLQTAVDRFREQQWLGAVWSASIAPTWESADGSLSNLQSQGFSAWTTYAYGLSRPTTKTKVQLIGQLRYRSNELVTDPEDENKTAEQDSLIAATRLRFGRPDFNGFVEGAYVRLSESLHGDGVAWRAACGIEKRLAKNVWLVFSAGQQFGDASEQDNFFATGSLRFGSSQSPQFDSKQ